MSPTATVPVTISIRRVIIATLAFLLIPAIAMQLTREVNWGPGDFLAAFALLASTGTAWVLLLRKLATRGARVCAGIALGVCLMLAWAELAVGLFR